jgi:hypothetical protein
LRGRRGSGRFPIYGGDGDRWAVRGDLKGLYEVGGERGFGDDQRGFVIVHPQLNGFQAESDDQKVVKCLLGGKVGGNISHRVLEVGGQLVCGRRWRRMGCCWGRPRDSRVRGGELGGWGLFDYRW